MLRLGSGVSAAAFALIAFGGDLLLLSAGSILLGFGHILTAVSGQGYIPAMSQPQDYDKRFGGLALAISIGQSAGLPLAGAIASASLIWGSHTTMPLWTMGVIAAGSTLLTLSPKFAIGHGPKPPASVPPQGVRRMLATHGMRPAIFSSLIVLTSVDMMTAYLPAFGEQHNFSVLIITFILTARSVSSALSRLFLTRLLRAVPRPWLLASATLGSALPIALIPMVPNPLAVGLMMTIAGFFWGIGQPLTMTWVANLVAPSSRATALSLRLTGNRLGQVLVPLAAAALSGVSGTAAVFVLTGGLLAGAGVSTLRTLYRADPT
jgi:MFS family permease